MEADLPAADLKSDSLQPIFAGTLGIDPASCDKKDSKAVNLLYII